MAIIQVHYYLLSTNDLAQWLCASLFIYTRTIDSNLLLTPSKSQIPLDHKGLAALTGNNVFPGLPTNYPTGNSSVSASGAQSRSESLLLDLPCTSSDSGAKAQYNRRRYSLPQTGGERGARGPLRAPQRDVHRLSRKPWRREEVVQHKCLRLFSGFLYLWLYTCQTKTRRDLTVISPPVNKNGII